MKKKKRNRAWKNAGAIFLCLLAAVLFSRIFIKTDSPLFAQNFTASVGKEDLDVDLYSHCAILVDAQSGEVLFEQNADDRAYPASLTKIMTALLAIEKNEDLDQTTVLGQEMFESLSRENASMAGFKPGERLWLTDLLYGTLLPSGAEAAEGLAEHTSGSQAKFVSLMNRRAKELGMQGTRFENATGLHAKNHYTTARDLAKLLCAALKNSTFRTAFQAERYVVAPTNLHPDGVTLYSTAFQKLGDMKLSKGEFLGGKTGYTAQAGLCLASAAKYRDQELILVTMGADGSPDTPQYNLLDALVLYPRYFH